MTRYAKILLSVLLLSLMLGCARLTFDPSTGATTYSRWGDQQVSVLVEKTGENSWKVEAAQQSQATALNELAKTVNTLAGKVK